MIYALCEKLWQHNFTIATVVKLLASVRNLACIVFRPEALDVHDLVYLPEILKRQTRKQLNSQTHQVFDDRISNSK